MDLHNYDNLSDVDSSSYYWKCRVRVQPLWKGMNRETQEFWGFNMLLIDDMNHRIHAFANAKYCAELTCPLLEGGIYIVDNFKVKDFLGDETYHPVRNKKHIFFTKDTKLSRATEPGLVIEKYAFDLFHMTEIDKLATDNRFLVDMVGYLKNRRPLITSTKNSQEKQRLKFDLVDGRFCVPVTLFDEFGIIIDKALQQLAEEEPIIIISCARVSSYEGRAHLTNYPATRIFINPDHYSVDDLINRCDEMTEMFDVDEEDTKQTLTVRDITRLTETHVQREVVCQVVIDKVNEDANCFRLETKCSDDSGSLTIVLPHATVAQISQKTVEDLYSPDKEELGEQQFPPYLRMFEKQNYNITVIITEENVMKGSEVYEATGIGKENESGGTFTPSSNQTLGTNEMSAMNVSLNKDTLMQALDTAKSTSKKVRARKLHAPLPFDEEGQIKNEPKLDKSLTHLVNKFNDAQKQVKLILTDGRLTQPAFQQEMYAMDKHAVVEMLNVARIISLGKEYSMMGEDKSFPSELKALVNRKYTIKLIIKEFNILHKEKTYFATNICTTFTDPNQHLTEATTSMHQQTTTNGGIGSRIRMSINKILGDLKRIDSKINSSSNFDHEVPVKPQVTKRQEKMNEGLDKLMFEYIEVRIDDDIEEERKFLSRSESNDGWENFNSKDLEMWFLKVRNFAPEDLILPRTIWVECKGLPMNVWLEEKLKGIEKIENMKILVKGKTLEIKFVEVTRVEDIVGKVLPMQFSTASLKSKEDSVGIRKELKAFQGNNVKIQGVEQQRLTPNKKVNPMIDDNNQVRKNFPIHFSTASSESKEESVGTGKELEVFQDNNVESQVVEQQRLTPNKKVNPMIDVSNQVRKGIVDNSTEVSSAIVNSVVNNVLGMENVAPTRSICVSESSTDAISLRIPYSYNLGKVLVTIQEDENINFDLDTSRALNCAETLGLEIVEICKDEALWLAGDFNSIKDGSERVNCEFSRSDMKGFQIFISNSNLMELVFIDERFSWFGSEGKCSKLDKFLVNGNWFEEGQ
ncbi:hypothetical protein AgCh_039522 [Apium graveolens]